MTEWAIIFILLCIFYGPIYVMIGIIGLAAAAAPGTRDSMPSGLFAFMMVIFAIPFGVAGYMMSR